MFFVVLEGWFATIGTEMLNHFVSNNSRKGLTSVYPPVGDFTATV
jgi:hypothetical protein